MKLSKYLAYSIILFVILLSNPAAGRAESFDLIIVPTVDDQLDSWLKVPPQLNPTIHIPNKIYPNQPFALRVLFKNYTLSKVKNAHITYDVQFFDPYGKPTADRGENLLGYNGPVQSEKYIIINQQLLRVFFDADYPFGEYEIKVIAKDHQTGKSIANSVKFELAPFKKTANFVSFDFFTYWVRNYFRQPDIAKAIFGYLQYFEDNQQWLQSNINLVAFANRLLDNNPWIWPHLANLYRQKPKEKNKIIALMALNNHLLPELAVSFNKEDKIYFDRIRGMQRVESADQITNPQQIDLLLGDFYATGHLAPIEKIVRLLKSFALSEPPEKGFTPQELEQVAFWSLVDLGKEVPLLTSFCSYLYESSSLPAENKVQLRLVLEVIKKSLIEAESAQSATDKKNPPSLPR